jgi:HSP20 family protein
MWNLTPWKKDMAEGRTMTAEPMERHFAQLRNDFDSLISRMWNDFPGFSRESFGNNRFELDVEETESHFIAHLAAPGFETGDFDVNVRGNQLLVNAEHKESKQENGGSSFRYGKVQQMLPLPQGVQAEQVEATYHNGVLDLKIPKGEEKCCQRIEVKAS